MRMHNLARPHLHHANIVFRSCIVALVSEILREVARVEEEGVAEQWQQSIRVSLGNPGHSREYCEDQPMAPNGWCCDVRRTQPRQAPRRT